MIYGTKNNIFDAVNAVVNKGVAAVEGTKTPAIAYAKSIIEHLITYSDIEPIIGYQNVPNEGYLYYVFDANRFSFECEELKQLIYKIDAEN